MLSKEDNDILCRVGPGTPMGDLMRQYWLPALLSSELPAPDCPPTRLRLLGEDLIGFRTTSDKVGVVVNACPHRGASIFFGRNEEEGLRCVYHGWKFDVTGACVDMPSEPAESNFKSKVRTTAYPCQERGGVIWTYMGSRETPPPLPDIEPNMLPEGAYALEKTMRECNYMQSLEGDIDTAHLSFLHTGALKLEDLRPGSYSYYAMKDRSPRYDVIDTEYGTSYGTYRPAEADTTYWRIGHFLMPFYSMIPTGVLGMQVYARAWVPLDDEHSMLWSFVSRGAPPGAGENSGGGPRQSQTHPGNYRRLAVDAMLSGRTSFSSFGDMKPDTSDFLGKFRPVADRSNDYLIDRDKQARNESFTGIPTPPAQDQAVTESMGPIYTRSNEHLGSTDSMVIRTRRRLINAAKALRNAGATPSGVDNPEFYGRRSGGIILHNAVDWRTATSELQKAFVTHDGLSEDPYVVTVGSEKQ